MKKSIKLIGAQRALALKALKDKGLELTPELEAIIEWFRECRKITLNLKQFNFRFINQTKSLSKLVNAGIVIQPGNKQDEIYCLSPSFCEFIKC